MLLITYIRFYFHNHSLTLVNTACAKYTVSVMLFLCCTGWMDILPASECVDVKLSDPSPVPQFPCIDLDNSEVSEGVNECVSMCTESPKSTGISFQLSNCTWHIKPCDVLLLFNTSNL